VTRFPNLLRPFALDEFMIHGPQPSLWPAPNFGPRTRDRRRRLHVTGITSAMPRRSVVRNSICRHTREKPDQVSAEWDSFPRWYHTSTWNGGSAGLGLS